MWSKGNTLFIFLLLFIHFFLYYLYHQLYFIFIYFSNTRKYVCICRPVAEKLWHSQYIISHFIHFLLFIIILYIFIHVFIHKCGTRAKFLQAETKQNKGLWRWIQFFVTKKNVLFVKFVVIIYLSRLNGKKNKKSERQETFLSSHILTYVRGRYTEKINGNVHINK